MLETFTIRPAGDLRMSGNSFCVSATDAKKFVSKVSRNISDDTAVTGFGPEPVAEISPPSKRPRC